MFDVVAFTAVSFSLALPAFIVWVVVSRRHKERVELIKQGVNPDGNTLNISLPGDKALKWGLIFLAFGLAGIIYLSITGLKFVEEGLFFTIASALVGVALIIYYRLTADNRARAREIQEKMLESGKYGAYSKLVVENGDNEPK